MIKREIRNIHWSYYLALESDVEKIARYIEFTESNYCTHSIELAHLLLAASSEVDALLKETCALVSPGSASQNINAYKIILNNEERFLSNHKVVSRIYGLHFDPWLNWTREGNPEWWWAYNKVKHERSNYFHLANLKNTLNSMAALLVANINFSLETLRSERADFPYELSDAISGLYPTSQLFRIDDPLAYHKE